MNLKDKSFREIAALIRERDAKDSAALSDRYGDWPPIERRIDFVNGRAMDALIFLAAVLEKMADEADRSSDIGDSE